VLLRIVVLGIPNDGLHIHLVHNEVCVCVCVWYGTSESFTGRTSRSKGSTSPSITKVK
jgi:hypothetical protein